MPLLFVILLGVFTISIIYWGDYSKTAVANLGYLVCSESSLAKKCKKAYVCWGLENDCGNCLSWDIMGLVYFIDFFDLNCLLFHLGKVQQMVFNALVLTIKAVSVLNLILRPL